MKNVKIISGVFCAVVMLVCLMGHLSYSRKLMYDICTPYAHPLIESYEVDILEEIPEGYLLPDHMTDDINDMKVVEITYSLESTLNDTVGFWGDLCYYRGEDGKWINDILDKDEDYWGVRNYEYCNILPAGEHVIYKEYVMVPKDMKQISADRAGGKEEFVIDLID